MKWIWLEAGASKLGSAMNYDKKGRDGRQLATFSSQDFPRLLEPQGSAAVDHSSLRRHANKQGSSHSLPKHTKTEIGYLDQARMLISESCDNHIPVLASLNPLNPWLHDTRLHLTL